MPVEVYVSEKFRHSHERKAFGRFLQEMLDRYQDSDDLYLIIVEPEANTAAMDMLILTPRAIIIVELKELGFAQGEEIENIILHASEGGDWEYTIGNGSTYPVGGRKKRNPYQQVKQHRYHLRDWLSKHSTDLPGGPWSDFDTLRKIYAWVVISPGFHVESSEFDLPWGEIDRWFKILPFGKLGWEVGSATNPGVEFSDGDMVRIATKIGARRYTNLSEFVPNYVPPAPPISFFGKPPVVRRFFNRESEKAQLLDVLDDPTVSVVNLGGPGGIGKTYLAAWLIQQAKARGIGALWVECSEREVTIESFLAAIADKIPDKYQAAFIRDPKKPLPDKFDLVIDFLEKGRYLLVFNDYHLVASPKKLNDFFSRVVNRATDINILLTSRVRLDILDDPTWPLGTATEMVLDGLPADIIVQFFPNKNFTTEQLQSIWERTSGNPTALRLMASLLRTRSWNNQIGSLPLFSDAKAQEWANSLIETLDDDIRILAGRIAVVRSSLEVELITKLNYKPFDKTISMIYRLVDAYILQDIGDGQYKMPGYIREAFLSRITEGELRKAHKAAGSFFQQMASDSESAGEQIEALLQCLFHFEQAENWRGILEQTEQAYDILVSRGDKKRAWSISQLALRTARSSNNKVAEIKWLIRMIRRELDLKKLDSAQSHIGEGFDLIAKLKKGNKKYRSDAIILEAKLWIEKGRYFFRRADYQAMEECFQNGLALAESFGDEDQLARLLAKTGRLERYRGNNERAKQYLIDASDLATKVGNWHLLAMCFSQLGIIARDSGDLAEASRLFRLALEKDERISNVYGAEINRSLLGDIELRLGHYQEAEQIFRERLRRAKSANDSFATRVTLGWLAETLIHLEELDEAEDLLSECFQRSEEANDLVGIAWTLKRKGMLEHAKGNVKVGNGLILQGIGKLEQVGNKTYLDDFRNALMLDEKTEK